MSIEHQIADFLPRLRRFARAMSRSRSDADDLAQMTVERALRAKSQWRRGTRLDSWLFRIARNLWIDTLRRRARRQRLQAEAEVQRLRSIDPRPGIEAAIDLDTMMNLMSRLPANQREVLALVLFEQVGYREAARILGIPIGTIASRLTRGRIALMAILNEHNMRMDETRLNSDAAM